MGSDLDIEFGPERAVNKVPRRLADTTAARDRIGFEAEVDLDEGLRRLVEWWRAERAQPPDGGSGRGKLDAGPVRTTAPAAAARPRPWPRSIASGWVSQGPRVQAFERAFAERVGAPEAIATTSCTTALHLALYAAGVGRRRRGDRAVDVVHRHRQRGVAVRRAPRCSPTSILSTYNLDPAAAERAITERTKAIMPVHQLGLPADLDAFCELADRYGLVLVEDAACAIGAMYKGARSARCGSLACFSLHPRKVITTGEGGMITVHDAELAARMRQLRQHAMDVSDLARHSAKDVVVESYPERGFNVRMTDMQAALGLCQMEVLDHILERRRYLAERYTALLERDPGSRDPVRSRTHRAHLAVLLRSASARGSRWTAPT